MSTVQIKETRIVNQIKETDYTEDQSQQRDENERIYNCSYCIMREYIEVRDFSRQQRKPKR